MYKYIITFFISCFSLSVSAQQSTLKGRVLNTGGQPVEYATVLFRNLDRSTYTDSSGYFYFRIPAKYTAVSADLKIAIVGKKMIERTVSLNDQSLKLFYLEELSLSLDTVEINQVRKTQNSNSSIIFDRQALDQIQAFSLADVLNNLPGKKTVAPGLQSPQTLTLRTEATGSTALSNSFGAAIIIDDIQQSNNANMQNRNTGKWGITGSALSNNIYGSFDTPFSGLDLRDIPVDNIESVEVITGVAPAKYGDLSSGAVIINRQAGKTAYQFSTRINGATSNYSLSKGIALNKKWGAINYSLNYLNSNDDPSDQTKKYERISGNLMWTSYLLKHVKNTVSLDLSTKIDKVKLDPDDGFEISTYSKARSLSVSNRTSVELGNSIAKRIDLSIGYSNSYSESYNQRYINGAVKGITDKDTSGVIYQGYYIPGNYLAVEHIKGNPVNINGNISLANEIYTGRILHKLSIGGNLYYAQNHGQGVIFDPTKPRWANTKYQNDRPYSYENLPDIKNYGVYLQDNFKLPLFKHDLVFNPGLRYDIQNGQANLQPRINSSYQLNKNFELNAAFGISAKGPSLAHRYPAPSYVDLILLNKYTGYVNESVLLVYTDKIVADNSQLKSSQSTQFEFGAKWKNKFITSSLYGYYKHDINGFSNLEEYHAYTMPNFDYTYVQGGAPVVTANGTYTNRYVQVIRVANDLNSKNYGLEWIIATKKIESVQTSFSVSNSFSYSIFNNNNFRTIAADESSLQLGAKAWFGIYAPNKFTNWNLLSKFSTTTHIPKLGFVVNLLADVNWNNSIKTIGDVNEPVAYLDKNLTRYEITNFDAKNPDYGYLKLSTDDNSNATLPFPVVNMSLRIAKEIRKTIRISVSAYNFLNMTTRYYNSQTNSVINYTSPTSVGAELTLKF